MGKIMNICYTQKVTVFHANPGMFLPMCVSVGGV